MSEYAFQYLLLGVLGLLSIFSFVIGLEQMIKIVISNYIINIICLSVSNAISLLIAFFNTSPDARFLGILFSKRETFFASGQTTILLILYGTLLVTVFTYSKLHITLPDDNIIGNTIQIIMIPMTVFSVLFSLQIAIFGDKIVSIEHLATIATKISTTPGLTKAIILTPVRIAIHALISLRLTTQVGITYQPSMSQGEPGM